MLRRSSTRVARDLFGFPVPKSVDEAVLKSAEESYRPIRKRQRADWNNFATANPDLAVALANRSSREVKRLVRGGIPHERRREVWMLLSGGAEALDKNREVYGRLAIQVDQKGAPPEAFSTPAPPSSPSNSIVSKDDAGAPVKYLAPKKGSPLFALWDQIERDLPRTFPGHPRGDSKTWQAALRRVLRAYSVHDESVGYCQSMNFIAGFALMFMCEEEAFWLLATIVDSLLPPGYYTSSMGTASVDQRVLADLLQVKRPRLKEALEEAGVPLPAVTSGWFLPLFVRVLPTETTLRVWDMFLMEGSKALFRFAIALFRLHETALIGRAKGTEPGDVFEYLQDMGAASFDCEALVNSATSYMGSFPMKRIAELRGYHLPKVYGEVQKQQKLDAERKTKEAAKAAAAAAQASKDAAASGPDGSDAATATIAAAATAASVASGSKRRGSKRGSKSSRSSRGSKASRGSRRGKNGQAKPDTPNPPSAGNVDGDDEDYSSDEDAEDRAETERRLKVLITTTDANWTPPSVSVVAKTTKSAAKAAKAAVSAAVTSVTSSRSGNHSAQGSIVSEKSTEASGRVTGFRVKLG